MTSYIVSTHRKRCRHLDLGDAASLNTAAASISTLHLVAPAARFDVLGNLPQRLVRQVVIEVVDVGDDLRVSSEVVVAMRRNGISC